VKKGYALIIICIFFLLVVHVLFRIPAPFLWLEAVWEAGDLIAFVGTITLGFVAYWQTRNANELSERLAKLEESNFITAKAAVVVPTDIKFEYKNLSGYNLSLLYTQVLEEDKEQGQDFGCFHQTKFTIEVKPFAGFIQAVKVHEANVQLCDTKNDDGTYKLSEFRKYTNFREGYSTVGIKDESSVVFSTILMTKNRESGVKLQNTQQNGHYGWVQMMIEFVTFARVSAKYSIRIHLHPDNDIGKAGILCVSKIEPPISFFREAHLLKDVEFIVLGPK
jgi:hypothetical protein